MRMNFVQGIIRLWRARQVIDPSIDDRLNVLGQQSTFLTTEISSLEDFIVASPKTVEEQRLFKMNTLPAPDELVAAPALRLSRQQARALRVRRYKDLCGFLFLLASLGTVLLWLSYQLTYYSVL